MSWAVRDAMSEQLDLATLAGQSAADMAELCRRFRVSRKTGYDWLERFRADGKGERCLPLTVLDDHSRYLLGAKACADEREATVHERLERVFEEYGLPDAMLTDNGNPPILKLAGQQHGPTKLTRLSVWLIRLGIRPLGSRPILTKGPSADHLGGRLDPLNASTPKLPGLRC
jgi:transposase InsO family protein